MSELEQPVIGVYRSASTALGENVPVQRVGALLARGARVVLLGGQEGTVHGMATGIVDGPLFEVEYVDGRVPMRVAAHEDPPKVAVHALHNTRRDLLSGPSVPALNSDGLREQAAKDHIYTGAFASFSPQTKVATSVRTGLDALDFSGKRLLVRPVSGSRGKGVAVVGKSDLEGALAARFESNPTGHRETVQEVIEMKPGPVEIKAANPSENDRLRHAKAQELRFFAVNGQLIPMARVARGKGPLRGQDTYLALDPETIPLDLYMMVQGIQQALANLSRTPEMSIAIDLFFGCRPGKKSAEWWLCEINTIDPEFPDPDKYDPRDPNSHVYLDLAHELLGHRADQLIRMARTAIRNRIVW